jgi:pre-rRNA-processing protein TSR1
VVRGLFGCPADVRWFRPVDLWTRAGRRGRIREPVGTHGALKAVFDGPVTQQDAVCMSLYKRAFPVWPDRHGADAFADA